MSGLEAIPIVTGIVCAVGAAKSLFWGKKNDRGRIGREQRDERNYRDGRHSRRSRSRRRSSSRTSRTISLSRDTPHSIVFKYRSRSESQLFDSSRNRICSRTPHSRRSSPHRKSSRRRRHRSSNHDGQRRNRRNSERLHSDDRAPRLIMPSPYDEAPHLDFCNGRVDRVRRGFPDGSYLTDIYVCKRCNLEIVGSGIASWHKFLPSDRGEVKLHKNFILRSHEARDGKFGCMLCHRWMPEFRSLVLHLRNHRYADLEDVVPESEWIGSELNDWRFK